MVAGGIMVVKRPCSPQSRLLLIGASALGCATLWAAGGAHEHGAAELFLSAEGKDAQISVNLPAQSILGFETTAISAEQKAAVESAQASLMLPNTLFTLGGNACTLVTANVDVSSIMEMSNAHSQTEGHADHPDEEDHTGHDEEDHTGHDKEESHTDHHEEQEEVSAAHDQAPHDHEDSDLDAPTTSHSDISAAYTFKCESDDTLTQMTFGRDELPYRLERIDVFWVADWGQGAGQATPQSPQVSLRD
jgi:hypothetical protein